MDFSTRKLPYGVGLELVQVPLSEIKPFALVVSPAYVLLKQNSKYLAVKGPLDFFTPEDLLHLQPMQMIFFTEFRENALKFQNVARSIRALLAWRPEFEQHPVAPFERSDAVTRLLAQLWAREGVLEPFFGAVFVDELCGPLPGELLRRSRSASVYEYDHAVLKSSLAVILALLLGWNDLAYLAGLRLQIFMGQGPAEILSAVQALIVNPDARQITLTQVEKLGGDFRRLGSKISRIQKSIPRELPIPSIRGARGFLPA